MYELDKRSIALDGTSTSYLAVESSDGVFDSDSLTPSSTKSFTVQLWIKPETVSEPQPLVQIPLPLSTTNPITNAAVSHGIYVGLVGARIMAQVALENPTSGNIGWGNAITQSEVVTAGVWTHVTAVYTITKKLEIYVDGQQQLLYPATHAASAAVGSFTANTAGNVVGLQQPPGLATYEDLYTTSTGSPMRIGYAEADTLT
eukprot:scaffold215350_cov46-Prasinocladus_malaysianus.AAC.1